MKKYLFILIVLGFSSHLFAQSDELRELYKMPKGQIIKFYKQTNAGSLYFFNTERYNKRGLIYFRYLLLKDPRVLSIQKNAKTPVVTIAVSHELEREDFKEQILKAIEEFTYVIENYDNYAEEIENLIYQGG